MFLELLSCRINVVACLLNYADFLCKEKGKYRPPETKPSRHLHFLLLEHDDQYDPLRNNLHFSSTTITSKILFLARQAVETYVHLLLTEHKYKSTNIKTECHTLMESFCYNRHGSYIKGYVGVEWS
jgi:hypothetical protein